MNQATASPLLSKCSFLVPEDVVVSAWTEHAPFAFWLTEQLAPCKFVELGTHLGFSYFAVCQVVKKLGLKTACYAVDTWKGDQHAGFYPDGVCADVVGLNRKYEAFSTLIRSTFADAVTSFADKSIDLLHIDGRHFYEDVKEDFELWLPKVADGGVVLFHDTNVREREFGVWRLFQELSVVHPTFEFLHGHGLGVLVIGAVPESLRPLFSADEDGRDFVRLAYSNLGAQLNQRFLSEKLPHKLESLKRYYERARSRLQASYEQKLRIQENTELPQDEILRFLSQQQRPKPVSKPPKELVRKNFFSKKNHQHRNIIDDYKTLALSPLFDPEWYIEKYPNVAENGEDPVYHYLKYGGIYGMSPGPLFDAYLYLEKNTDVKNAAVNPLLHLIRCGAAEKRQLGVPFLPHSGDAASGMFMEPYDRWVRECDTLSEGDISAIKQRIASLGYQPIISVIMPVYNTEEEVLRTAIDSVIAQLYPNWELCISDDASPNLYIKDILEDYSFDDRIKWMRRDRNGHISAASNSALAMASGEFVALMDHDDILPVHALYEVVEELNRYPDADLIYSDEDRIDDHGRRSGPYFKTEWNRELLLGHNMVSHLGVYRRSLVARLGGLREGFEGSQDYDLALRVADATEASRIRHIPAVLYHWRQSAAEMSFSDTQLERCAEAARRAVSESLKRKKEVAVVERHDRFPYWQRIHRALPSDLPLVSLIVPTKDMSAVTQRCLDGLLNRTDYSNIEIIVVDHQSREPETAALFASLSHDKRIRILPYTGPFNYSAINNAAAKVCGGTLLGLINNDIEVISPNWLGELVSYALMPDVGAVGARLLYSNGRVQHGGVVLGVVGPANHFCRHLDRDNPGYLGRAVMTSEVSAVTGACLVTRKSVFDEVGGLDEVNLPVAFNDVDFCLRLREQGYRNIYLPFAELYHHESSSRGSDAKPDRAEAFGAEVKFMHDRWKEQIEFDPYYNPNLSLDSEVFEFGFPSRRKKYWKQAL